MTSMYFRKGVSTCCIAIVISTLLTVTCRPIHVQCQFLFSFPPFFFFFWFFFFFLVLLSINGPITDNETSLASAPGPQTRGSMTVLLLCNLYPIQHVVVEYIVPVHAL